jgi:hypothetical protein
MPEDGIEFLKSRIELACVETFSSAMQDADSLSRICEDCKTGTVSDHNYARSQLWDGLPLMLGLADNWDELKRFWHNGKNIQ